jgi:hypothetical protein
MLWTRWSQSIALSNPKTNGRNLRARRSRSQAYVAIDGGHFACYTNAQGFAAVLEERILPLTA